MEKAQFVGLYVVGEDETSNVLLEYMTKALYINSLYCTKNFQVSPHMVLPLLGDCDKGLYIGIITQLGATREVKTIPIKEGNQSLIESILDKEVQEQCFATMSVLFGGSEATDDGAPTPEYVDQDR